MKDRLGDRRDRPEHAGIRDVPARCTVRPDSRPLGARAGSTVRPGLEALRPDRLPVRPAALPLPRAARFGRRSRSRTGPGRAGLARSRPSRCPERSRVSRLRDDVRLHVLVLRPSHPSRQGSDLHRLRPQGAGPRDADQLLGWKGLRDRLLRLCPGRARPVGAPVDPDRIEGLLHLRVPVPARRRQALDAQGGRFLVQARGEEPRRDRGRADRRRQDSARRRPAAGPGDANALRRRRGARASGQRGHRPVRPGPRDASRSVRGPRDDAGRADRSPWPRRRPTGMRPARSPSASSTRRAGSSLLPSDHADGAGRCAAGLGHGPGLASLAGGAVDRRARRAMRPPRGSRSPSCRCAGASRSR